MNSSQQQAIDTFLPCMPDVARWEQGLHELNQMWHLIEASAKMNCPVEARLLLPSIIATRTGFAQLQRDLIANLVQEKVQQVLVELATRAQYMIDIVVRNLFERTADVGFLATDSELCRFAAGLAPGAAGVRQRLADYRAKYTVYDAILMLGLDGQVLLQTDDQAGLADHAALAATAATGAGDPLLAAATLAQPGYVETFRASALRPGKPRALLYSQRMLHPDTGEAVGVLCLSFHFEQEMAAIFQTYRDPGQRANMLLLDGAERVIASADPLWIPAGAKVPTDPGADASGAAARLRIFGGRAYLVRTFASGGYQGYPGPDGWKGQVMVPLDLAFRHDEAEQSASLHTRLDPALLQGLLSHAHSFNPALHSLMTAVKQTSRTIRHIVWNGKVTTAGALDGGDGNDKLNSILDQITETGQRGDDMFSRSIQELYQTVLSSSMHAASSTAQLLVDMLDRNLYERANDCRWWALTPQLRAGLAAAGDPAQPAAMGVVLDSINLLYPVYSRLLAYDRSGQVVAASKGAPEPGTAVDASAASRVAALADPQDHYAEPFGPSDLYQGQSTFIYHAAIRQPDPDQGAAPEAGQERGQKPNTAVVGGIGIVFDAAPELLNMLHSGVAARPNMHACYVRPDGRILASTDPAWPPGAAVALAADLLDGPGGARIVVHGGQYKIAATTRASGYREFRHGAASEEAVYGVVLVAFGAVRDASQLAEASGADAGADTRITSGGGAGRDFALFEVNGALMALPAARITEAVPFERVRTRAAAGACIGMLNPQQAGQPFIWVFDLHCLLTGQSAPRGPHSQVMLVRAAPGASGTIGLLVDELHSVHRFLDASMTAHPLAGDPLALCGRIIMAGGGLLIPEIDPARLFLRLQASTSG